MAADMDSMAPALVRAARGLLEWSMSDLAKAAGVSVLAVKRIEDGGIGVAPATLVRVRSALEGAGVQFLADEGGGPGLRLRPREVSPIARFF